MADDSRPENPKQSKRKKFVVRETPSWLLTHQDWITDGARHLYSVLRTLADHRTGRLFIPGRGWISPRAIECKAGIHEETRLKYTRELKELGAVSIHRDHVLREIKGRKRKVWGVAQITLLPLKPPNPHKHRVPSTPGNSPDAESEPQDKVPSTPGFTTPGAENPLLHPDSTGPVETGCQYSSEKHQDAAGVGSVGLERDSEKHPKAEEEENARAAPSSADDERIRFAFGLFGRAPFGSFAFQRVWLRTVETAPDFEYGPLDTGDGRKGRIVEAIERCIQNCNRAGIPVPPPLFFEKRLAESAAGLPYRRRR